MATKHTTYEKYLRKLVLEMYWDGEENPSVRVPFGDFFGIGHATCKQYISLLLNMIFGKRRGPKGPFAASMNSYFTMPFGTGAKIQIINESSKPIQNLFFMIDYELTEDPIPNDVGRFHAMYRQETPCKKISYKCEEENPTPWDLPGLNTTGDDMIFIDGEKWPPSLHGTGTEDYFGAAWGFPSGEYSAPYHGISLGSDAQEHFGKWSLYRFHIEDPVRFTKSIKVTIEHGHANDQGNDYSSVAYWYQLEPHKALPELPDVNSRLPKRWPEHGLWDC